MFRFLCSNQTTDALVTIYGQMISFTFPGGTPEPKTHCCDPLDKVPMMSEKGRILLGDEGLDGRGGIPR